MLICRILKVPINMQRNLLEPTGGRRILKRWRVGRDRLAEGTLPHRPRRRRQTIGDRLRRRSKGAGEQRVLLPCHLRDRIRRRRPLGRARRRLGLLAASLQRTPGPRLRFATTLLLGLPLRRSLLHHDEREGTQRTLEPTLIGST